MKYRILHNKPLEFYDTSAALVGTISANGTNLKINSVSGVIELGNTASDIQVGTTGTSINWSFLGGATIAAGGTGIINLGQSGDTLNMNVAGVNYQYPSYLVRYSDITATNNQINITTQVPGTINLALPNKPVVGQLALNDNVSSTSNTTGTLTVAGGAGIKGNVSSDLVYTKGIFTSGGVISGYDPSGTGAGEINGNLTFKNVARFSATGTSQILLNHTQSGWGSIGNLGANTFALGMSNSPSALIWGGTNNFTNNFVVIPATSNLAVFNTSTSVSNTTGALTVSGGVGIQGNVYSDAVFTTGSGTFTGGTKLPNSTYYGFSSVSGMGMYTDGTYLKFDKGGSLNFLINNTGPYSLTPHQFGQGSGTASAPDIQSGSWPGLGMYFPATGKVGIAAASTQAALFSAANTNSVNVATGTIVVTGGVGVSGNVYSDKIYTNGLYYASNGAVISTGGGGGSISLTDDTTTNATRYLLLSTATSGTMATANTSSSKLLYNPSTGNLSSSIVSASTGIIPNINNSYLTGATVTTTTTSPTALHSFSTSTYRSAKYFIQMTSGSAYHMIEVSLIHDGTTVYMSQYGEIKTGASLGTFDASITTGALSIQITPASATSTVTKAAITLIPV